MKVLHVIPSLDPDSGGPARSVPGLCAALAAAGVDVSLLGFSTSDPVHRPDITSHLLRPLRGTRQGVTVHFLRTLRRLVRTNDLVHIHSLWNPPVSFAAVAAQRAGTPYVVSPRGMLQGVSIRRNATLKKVAAPLTRRILTKADGLHLLTDSELDASQAFIPSAATLLVAPNGVGEDLFDRVPEGAFRSQHPEMRDRLLVLFVGRLHWSKDLHLQLDAFERLCGHRHDVMWVLAGPDEGEWAKLSAAVAAKQLQDKVVWLGPLRHDRALEAIRDANVVLLASRHEAHSMTMNETLVLGTPLVLTESVGFPDLEQSGAALSSANDADQLSDALLRVLADPEMATELGARGRRFAHDHLSWPAIAARMQTFYSDIIDRRSRRPHR